MNAKFRLLITLAITLFLVEFSFSQEKTISGIVSDESGLPLPGASVLIKDTTTGTSTDFDGKYSINAKQGSILIFRFVGYETQEITIGASNKINVTMKEDAESLGEVIVTAQGIKKERKALGYAVSTVDSDDIEQKPDTDIGKILRGKASGVRITGTGGVSGSGSNIIIRGFSSITGNNQPLFVVDGVQFEGGLNTINQDDIESLTVLKDAASTSLYGSRGANGVVIITTKKGKKGSGLTVSATSSFGAMDRSIAQYDAVSPGEYYELMWEAYKNTAAVQAQANPEAFASADIFNRLGRNPFNVPNDQIVGVDGKLNPNAQVIAEDLDWFDALERQGTRLNNSVNVSGGGDDHTVFFSMANLQEKGYVIQSSYDRTTARLNASFDVTKWFSIGGNMSFVTEKVTGSPLRGTATANVFSFAKDMGSIYSPFLLDPATNQIIRPRCHKK